MSENLLFRLEKTFEGVWALYNANFCISLKLSLCYPKICIKLKAVVLIFEGNAKHASWLHLRIFSFVKQFFSWKGSESKWKLIYGRFPFRTYTPFTLHSLGIVLIGELRAIKNFSKWKRNKKLFSPRKKLLFLFKQRKFAGKTWTEVGTELYPHLMQQFVLKFCKQCNMKVARLKSFSWLTIFEEVCSLHWILNIFCYLCFLA